MNELLEMQKAANECILKTYATTGAFVASMLALQMEVANVNRCSKLPLGDVEAAIDAVGRLQRARA